MILTFQQIAQALSVVIAAAGTATGWSIDTRTLTPGDLFIALRGPNHDGHEHLETAFAKVQVGGLGAVKELLGDKVDYGQLRIFNALRHSLA